MAEASDVTKAVAFRRGCLTNGFTPLRLKTGEKIPISKNWTEGDDPEAVLRSNPGEANTGLLLRGLRVIDVDVDALADIETIKQIARDTLPKGALCRTRQNSPRFALIFRSESDEARKLVAQLGGGKIEILGSKQQLLVDGLHTSGARMEWMDERSPATVPQSSLPVLTESQISTFFEQVREALGRPLTAAHDPTWDGSNAELGANLDKPEWFSKLQPSDMEQAAALCLAHIHNTVHDPRDRWLSVLFAMHNAGDVGCPNARELAYDWSRKGKGWTSEADFDIAWNSYKPGGTTVGTLLHLAAQGGADLMQWRIKTGSELNRGGVTAAASGALLEPVAALDLPELPARRQWLHGTDLVRGAVSLLVAPGGKGKSTWLIHLALACATGRNMLGAHVFGGPLRVLYINAEDSTDELNRRIVAARHHHSIPKSDLKHLQLLGADRANLTLLEAVKGVSQLAPQGWLSLEQLIIKYSPDVLIIDPMVAITGGVTLNDNAAAALMMKQFVRLATVYRLGFMIAHHASKGRDATSQESAMGAASLVNLSRVGLNIETLDEKNAVKIGVAPEEARNYFRVIGTKQNLSPPSGDDRWFRLSSVTLNNAEPPVYLEGDKVAVIDKYIPTSFGSALQPNVLATILDAVRSANPPLAPSRRSRSDRADAAIAKVMSDCSGRQVSDTTAQTVIDELLANNRLAIVTVKVTRKGRGGYERDGLKVVEGAQPHNAKQMIGLKVVAGGLGASPDATKQ